MDKWIRYIYFWILKEEYLVDRASALWQTKIFINYIHEKKLTNQKLDIII
jgi:hypothetical protein